MKYNTLCESQCSSLFLMILWCNLQEHNCSISIKCIWCNRLLFTLISFVNDIMLASHSLFCLSGWVLYFKTVRTSLKLSRWLLLLSQLSSIIDIFHGPIIPASIKAWHFHWFILPHNTHVLCVLVMTVEKCDYIMLGLGE